jgi:hypothetical protein
MAQPPTDATTWPDPTTTLLLQAALWPKERALLAWRGWRDSAGARPATVAERRLFPMVWRNLGATCGSALRADYLEAWAQNQRILARASETVGRLQSAGVATMLLKGAALLSTCYQACSGARAVGDVDLLVAPERAADARRVLAEAGWRPMFPTPESRLPLLHGLNYEADDCFSLDLHWHSLMETCRPEDDRALWADARPVALIGGARSSVPAPADHLLVLCAHGVRWSASPSVHWLADAYTLTTGAAGAVDWERLLARVRALRLACPVSAAVDYLASHLEAPVPRFVLAGLAALPKPPRERLEHRARMRPPSVVRSLFLHWCAEARMAPDQPRHRRLLRMPERLRASWGLAGLADVPTAAARKSLGYLWRAVNDLRRARRRARPAAH